MPREILGITYYTYAEVAEMIGVSAKAVAMAKQAGRISGVRFQREIYISEQAIRDYIKSRTSEVKPRKKK